MVVSIALHLLLLVAALVVVFLIIRAPFTIGSLTALGAFFGVLLVSHIASAGVILRRYSADMKIAMQDEATARRLKLLLAEQERSGKLLIRRDLELTRANDQLRSLDKMKTEFVSVVTHQLRTPLSAMKWVLSMLVQGEFGQFTTEQRTFLLKAQESTDRMINLVNDLASADHLDSGRFRPEFVPTDPYLVMQNLLMEMQPLITKRDVRVTVKNDLPAGTCAVIATDNLRAVLQNLVENALRYTGAGGTVTLTLEQQRDMLAISVTDTGIGIPVNEQKMIFKRFYRAPNAVKMETDGSGLGLYIVRNIVEKYSGMVSFISKEGVGSTFTVKLPLAEKA